MTATSLPLIENWVNNNYTKSSDNKIYTVVHPNTNDKPHNVVSSTFEDIDFAVESANKAFKTWKVTTHNERRDILFNAARILRERKEEVFETYASELDVNHHFVEFLVGITSDMIETAATLIVPSLTGDIPPTKRDPSVMYLCQREPLGVCLALAPWNAATNLSIRAIVNPLAAGNTVIFRTSETTPKTHALWGKIFADAGLPAGALNIIHSSREDTPSTIEKLISDFRVRHVSFTGSTHVGKIIGKLSGYYLKPCILELGGKCPVLVLNDADNDLVAKQAYFHSWVNGGQICMATERVLVGETNYDGLIESFLKNAPPSSSSPIALKGSHEKIKTLVNEAIEKGAKVLTGNWPPTEEDEKLNKMPNLILTNVTKDMELYSEETFGPISIIIKVKQEQNESEDEAIVRYSNESRYGLATSIYSKDLKRALNLSREVECGLLRINEGTIADESVCPFGGSKDSGFGRFNGTEGIRQFTQYKTISLTL